MKKTLSLFLTVLLLWGCFGAAFAEEGIYMDFGCMRIHFPEGTEKTPDSDFTYITPEGAEVFFEASYAVDLFPFDLLSFEEMLGPQGVLQAIMSGTEELSDVRLSTTESGVGVGRAISKTGDMEMHFLFLYHKGYIVVFGSMGEDNPEEFYTFISQNIEVLDAEVLPAAN